MLRYVGWSHLRKDDDQNVLGVLPSAFYLRDEENYLSVTWCEYFDGLPDESLRCAIEAIRGSIRVGGKARFALANVGSIKSTMENEAGVKLRIEHLPEEDNPAHAAVKRWPNENFDLLELIASDAWAETIDATSANALPMSACALSPRATE
ncbi:hypothetical protein OEG84_19635 [Hoeflea sp. G2-23]|uniref:Uncharacterized protein n=1 Tax=Hoeflea algicola TaxID=2983763 RepID=A0ABT3ZDG5_9HYPH|nr:hypothetical protein [Hoeflea algicola]MCY0149850.1 hypothetical protein [Hoeflea algicola]